jgi:hypothetical protein
MDFPQFSSFSLVYPCSFGRSRVLAQSREDDFSYLSVSGLFLLYCFANFFGDPPIHLTKIFTG